MSARRYQYGPTPETTQARVRHGRDPAPRAASRAASALLSIPASTVLVESVTETIGFLFRARTNNAPLATGRHRR